MDEASSKLRLRSARAAEETPAAQIAKLKQREDEAWQAREYEEAAKLRQERLTSRPSIRRRPSTGETGWSVTAEHVAEVVAEWTGIPVRASSPRRLTSC